MTGHKPPADPASATDPQGATLRIERRLYEVELLLEEKARLLDAILDRTVQGLMLVSADRIVEVCNARAIDLLGLPATLMQSKPTFEQVLEYQWSTDEFAHTPEDVREFVRKGGILDSAHCYERKRPDGRVIEIQSVPIEGGGVLRTYTDITERRRSDEHIRHRARHDGLTSLINRDAFIEHVQTAIDEADAGTAFAVHYIDLDRFKPVNDRLGHAVGDQLLSQVAQRMRAVAREGDFVGRMGGDEFAILQAGANDAEHALGLAQRVLKDIERPIPVEDHRIEIGMSIGIALYPQHGATTDALLRNADAALYAAKSMGGHGAHVFDPERTATWR